MRWQKEDRIPKTREYTLSLQKWILYDTKLQNEIVQLEIIYVSNIQGQDNSKRKIRFLLFLGIESLTWGVLKMKW